MTISTLYKQIPAGWHRTNFERNDFKGTNHAFLNGVAINCAIDGQVVQSYIDDGYDYAFESLNDHKEFLMELYGLKDE